MNQEFKITLPNEIASKRYSNQQTVYKTKESCYFPLLIRIIGQRLKGASLWAIVKKQNLNKIIG